MQEVNATNKSVWTCDYGSNLLLMRYCISNSILYVYFCLFLRHHVISLAISLVYMDKMA